MNLLRRHILTLRPPEADLRLPYGADPLQFGDLRLPAGAGPHPVVVVVHGGYWRAAYDLTHAGHMAAALTALGMATWNVEYRRIGNDGGSWPGTFHDVATATDSLRALAATHRLDLTRVVALGHSAGGHLALWLAARHRIPSRDALFSPRPLTLRGVVALAPVADLAQAWDLRLSDGVVRELMGGAPQERPARYATASPAALLPLGLPQVLVHGAGDRHVPYVVSRDYQQAALRHGDDATLITPPRADHFALIDPRSKVWPSVAAAVSRLLSPDTMSPSGP